MFLLQHTVLSTDCLGVIFLTVFSTACCVSRRRPPRLLQVTVPFSSRSYYQILLHVANDRFLFWRREVLFWVCCCSTKGSNAFQALGQVIADESFSSPACFAICCSFLFLKKKYLHRTLDIHECWIMPLLVKDQQSPQFTVLQQYCSLCQVPRSFYYYGLLVISAYC